MADGGDAEEKDEVHVLVAVRCRPLSSKEKGENATSIVSFPGDSQIVLDVKGEEHKYAFDHALEPDIRQEVIYETLGLPLINQAFGGFNSAIFAYGQTGSGKTHTMLNHRAGPEERGLIPRISDGIYSRIATLTEQHPTRRFLIQCSFLEIYNEIIYDLLVPRNKQSANRAGLEIREAKGIGIYVKDLSEIVVDATEKLNTLIEQGFAHRQTAATKMNSESSRSHCIFIIKLHQKDAEDEAKNTFSKMNLIDLAGSERAKSTEAEGERLKEGANINKSLSALGNVINALSSAAGGKKIFVPYRNSKLTRVLQESLGGNSLCTMVAALSPSDTNAEETLSTLNYARRAKSIKVSAVKNEEASQIKKLQEEVEALKRKLEQDACKSIQASMNSEEKKDLESKYENQIEELQGFMKQSWEDKQKLSEQAEAAQKKVEEESQKAAERLRNERKRHLAMLAANEDIVLSLQSLTALGSKLCNVWPDKIRETLKVEQRLKSQLNAVKLYRESAAADLAAWRGRKGCDSGISAALLGQVKTKIASMSKELEALARLEGQIQEQFGQIMPQVAVALSKAQGEAGDIGEDMKEELVDHLDLVQRQLAEHQAKSHSSMQGEKQELVLKDELQWLMQSLEEDAEQNAERTSLVEKLKEESASLEAAALTQGADTGASEVLGLSTLELPDDKIDASSNGEFARYARLLQTGGWGGWSPEKSSGAPDPNSDAPEQYLSIDLGAERYVTGLSLQGRLPCSADWPQTRDLLKVALKNTPGLSDADKTYQRPPIRFIHEIGVAIVQEFDSFREGAETWKFSEELVEYGNLSREQKVTFFEELITRTNGAWEESGVATTVTPTEILSGKNCEESNRLLQMLAYLALVPPASRRVSGLGDIAPQWTTSWKLQCFREAAGWCWYGAPDGGGSEAASVLEANTDDSTVKFVSLLEPPLASKVRIHAVEFHRYPALRCEVHVASSKGGTSASAGASQSGPGRPGVKAGGSLEAFLQLTCKCLVEVKKGIEEKQEAKLKDEEAARNAEVTDLKDKAEQERLVLEQRLKDALAKVEELEGLNASNTERAQTAENALLQTQVERDQLVDSVAELEQNLSGTSEAKTATEGERGALQEECTELKGHLQEKVDELQVMSEERDASRANEEELFELNTMKDEELMDTNNGYVYLTERLQDKEDEMAELENQVRQLESSSEQVGDRCGELQDEMLALRLEHQKVQGKLVEEERMHKAAQDRYMDLVKNSIGAVGSGTTAAPSSSGSVCFTPRGGTPGHTESKAALTSAAGGKAKLKPEDDPDSPLDRTTSGYDEEFEEDGDGDETKDSS